MSAYRIDVSETKYMYFLIKDDELLEENHKVWEKAKNSCKKDFNSEPVYSKTYLKAKIKFNNRKIKKNFIIIKYQKKVLN